MCLYSKNRLPRVAWKSIKVYKIVYLRMVFIILHIVSINLNIET